MPTFRPVNAASQMQFAQPVTSYIKGRAMGMAYQQDKIRNEIMREQAQSLAYGNEPAQRIRRESAMEASTDVDVARAEQIRTPAEPDWGTRELKVGDNFETWITKDGLPWKPFSEASRRTGTEADPNLLGKRATGDVETQIIDLQGAMNEVNRINLDNADDLLTYQGKAESFLARQSNKLGLASDAQIARIHKDQKLRSQVRQAFQKIRKAVTGAQAAYIELTYLEDAYFSDKMGPEQLRAAKKVFIDSTRAAISVLTNLKQRGIQPGTPEFGEEFDRQWQQIKPEAVDQFIPQSKEPESEGGKDLGGGFSLTFG